MRHKGYFALVGRSKHMILSGGLNVYPAELEDVLMLHPDVADCAVFGVEDATWGELPAAAVISNRNGIDTDAVMEFVAGKVARYKRLRKIFLVDEIPRTVAGKAQIHRIKEQCVGKDE
jgi:fatty-acyl-CoA synthase